MCPARPIRGKAVTMAPKSINMECKCEWTLSDENPPSGFLKIQWPNSFPRKLQPARLQICEKHEWKSQTVPLQMDDSFLEASLNNPFLFIIRFPYEPPVVGRPHKVSKKPTESFIPEYFQVDAQELFFPDTTKIEAECIPPPSGYASFKFTVTVNRPMMDPTSLRRFSPLYLHLKSIDNMPELPPPGDDAKPFAPVFFKIMIEDKTFLLYAKDRNNDKLIIDTKMIICPRKQCEIKFELHDRDYDFPPACSFLGTTLVKPLEQIVRKHDGLFIDVDAIFGEQIKISCPYGYTSFYSLPERSQSVLFRPTLDTIGMIPAGKYHECQTQLKLKIFDPVAAIPVNEPQEEAPPAPVPAGKQSRVPPKTVKPAPVSAPAQEQEETATSQFHRWIVLMKNLEVNEKIYLSLMNAVNAHNAKITKSTNFTILQTFNYQLACKQSVDVITGFVLSTPREHVMVFETRANEPNQGTQVLIDATACLPTHVTVLHQADHTFAHPRIYKDFSSLVKQIDIPKSITEMIRIKELYFHGTEEYMLFGVVQKLNGLRDATSLKEADECDFFPTVDEIAQLYLKVDTLSSSKGTIHVNRKSVVGSPLARFSFCATEAIRIANQFVENTDALGATPLQMPTIPIRQRRPLTSFCPPEAKKTANKNKQCKTTRPAFEPFGKEKTIKAKTPRARIACSSNGEEEIWAVDDPAVLQEEGWEIEVLPSSREPQTERVPSRFVKSARRPVSARRQIVHK